jgi:hypothetical protein
MAHELEALIRTDGDGAYAQRRGDVICVKLASQAFWGTEELKYHQPVPWDDNNLKQQLEQMITEDGVSHPMVTLPYKQIEHNVVLTDSDGGQVGPTTIIKTRSYKYFNIDNIQNESLKNHILDNEIAVSSHDITDEILNACVLDKTGVEINQELETNKSRYLDIIATENPPYADAQSASDEKAALQRYVNQLKKYYNVDAKIVDGKIAVADRKVHGEI